MDRLTEWRTHANGVWRILAIFAVGVAGAVWAAGLTIAAHGLGALSLSMAIMGGIALFYQTVRHQPQLAIPAEACLQMFAMLMLGVTLTYAAACAGLPYRDEMLLAADRMIGFEWTAYAAVIDSHPLAAWLLRNAYHTLLPQLFVATVVLSLVADLARLRAFLIACIIALAVTGAVFALMPAVSVYAHLNIDVGAFRSIQPVSIAQHIAPIEGLRSGAHRTIAFGDLAGLVTFPSFHTAGAILATWAVIRVRVVRVMAVGLNILMLMSVPIDGAHYLIDLIGGVGLAVAAIFVAKRLPAKAAQSSASLAPVPA